MEAVKCANKTKKDLRDQSMTKMVQDGSYDGRVNYDFGDNKKAWPKSAIFY